MMNTKTWLDTRLPVISAWRQSFAAPVHAREKPYLATLPVLITAALVFMAASGFILSLSYDPRHPYDSIQFLDRNVNYGWLIHAFHETGTTMIFGAVFLDLFRAMLGRAYKAPAELPWLISVAQFILLLFIGYLGYLLSGGAVSYWSLANATAPLSGLPGAVQSWFFGGPAGPDTLVRMAVFHAVLALAVFGLVALHATASRAAAPPEKPGRPIGFHPYYTAQYFTAFVVFALIFAVLVFFAPHLGENALNQEAATPLLLPAIVTPPWYLLPLAGLSHAVNGTLGDVAVAAAFIVLAALPWLDRAPAGARPGTAYRLLTWLVALDVIGLALAAANQPSMIASICIILFTAYYFLHFIVLTPLVTALETR